MDSRMNEQPNVFKEDIRLTITTIQKKERPKKWLSAGYSRPITLNSGNLQDVTWNNSNK